MKFTIQQTNLLPAISAVSRCCSTKGQLPVLNNILISIADGRLSLSATNLEIGVVKSLSVEEVEEGSVTIPSKTLLETISNLSGEKITIEGKLDQIQITTPTFKASINGISSDEFPTIPLSGDEVATLDPKLLIKSLPEVIFSAAVDEGRPVLTGILTQISGKKLNLVATDGYRLAHKTIDLESDVSFKSLIPKRTLEEISRLISEEEVDTVNINISEDGNQIIFNMGNTQLSSRLIEGNFPTWEKIIPAEYKARVVVEKQRLLKAVKLSSVFARSEANIVKIINEKDKLILSSAAKELGNQTTEVECQSEGERLEIAFNTKFLSDVLSSSPSSSTQIIMELSGNLSAASFKPMGEEGLQYIIMPVNLS